MENALTRALTKIAAESNHSQTTESVYFQIGCIKIRVSDHLGPQDREDLAIYPVEKGYVVFPTIGVYRKVHFFTSVKATIAFIQQFEEIAELLVKGDKKEVKLSYTPSFENKTPKVVGFIDLSNPKAPVLEIQKGLWQTKLEGLYNCKVVPLKELLDKLYDITPASDRGLMLTKLSKIFGLTPSAKQDYLLNEIKHLDPTFEG